MMVSIISQAAFVDGSLPRYWGAAVCVWNGYLFAASLRLLPAWGKIEPKYVVNLSIVRYRSLS